MTRLGRTCDAFTEAFGYGLAINSMGFLTAVRFAYRVARREWHS